MMSQNILIGAQRSEDFTSLKAELNATQLHKHIFSAHHMSGRECKVKKKTQVVEGNIT